jgi:hypothetical protein
MMLIIPDEVVTGALVNAIAVVGCLISQAEAGSYTAGDLTSARWFETFRMTGTLPDQPDRSFTSRDRLSGLLRGDEVQAALQELAAQLTDAPENDASRARDAVRMDMTAVEPDVARFAEALAGYYDSQICSFVGHLESKDPLLLAQVRSDGLSARMITIPRAIERHTAVLADEGRWPDARQAIELLEAGT